MHTFDDILKRIGEFGPYQKKVYAWICLPALSISSLLVTIVFLLRAPEHRCKLPGYENDTFAIQSEYHRQLVNVTIPAAGNDEHPYDRCHYYQQNASKVKCGEWVYSTELFENTFTKQMNLVCDDALKISHAQMIFFFGVLLGSLVFGQLSDSIGRRKTLYICMLILLGSGVAVAFAPEYISFCILLFIMGSATLGTYMTSYVIGMELVGPHKRLWTGNIIQIVLTAGTLYLTLVVWLIRDWKYFQLAATAPALLYLANFWTMPESVRWLLSKNRKEEAQKILEKVARVNNKELPEKAIDNLPPIRKQGRIWQLFQSKLLGCRTVIIFFNWFVVSMSYYGTVLNIGNLGGNFYLNMVLMTVVEFPAKFLGILLLDRLGRKRLYIYFMIIGGLACIGTIFPIIYDNNGNLHPLLIALSMIGKGCVTGGFGAIYVLSAELFPTVVRNAGMGTSSAVARVGSMLAPYIAQSADLVSGVNGKAIPLTLFGIAMFVAGLLSMTLPETLNRTLPESIEDAKSIRRKSTKKNATKTANNAPTLVTWKKTNSDTIELKGINS